MKFILLLSLCCWTFSLNAQDTLQAPAPKPNPPVVAELMFGHDRIAFQSVIDKRFTPKSRLGYFSVSTIAVGYRNDSSANEYVTPVQLTYELIKGLSLNAGGTINSNSGFRPFAGLKYSFANREVLAVIVPGFFLSKSRSFETLVLFEYRPTVRTVHLYSRLQGLYNQSRQMDAHERSYAYARLGVSFKTITYGVGTNLDWYGPMKLYKENYGVFVRAELN